jgi:hypothetical protein
MKRISHNQSFVQTLIRPLSIGIIEDVSARVGAKTFSSIKVPMDEITSEIFGQVRQYMYEKADK